MNNSLSAAKATWVKKANTIFVTEGRVFLGKETPEIWLTCRVKEMLAVLEAKVGDEFYDISNDRVCVWVE